MPSHKKRPVLLTEAEREELVRVTTTGVHSASRIMRARVLLALDTSMGEIDFKEVIAARLEVSVRRCGWSRSGSPIPVVTCTPRLGVSSVNSRRCLHLSRVRSRPD